VEERRAIFNLLRREFPIHTIEATLNIEAEIILDAISRSDDLTVRGVRGVIAQAAFALDVVGGLRDWRDITQGENLPYDFLLTDGHGDVRVQVKMQRQKYQRPMMANEGYRYLSPNMYVVETQRTRGGKDASGADTRPYRFGEFDILAVAMHPSTGSWKDFMYTVARWLLPRPENPSLLLKFQPVARVPNDDWTGDFLTAVAWLRSDLDKQIRSTDPDSESKAREQHRSAPHNHDDLEEKER
jgi:hypothetical protein